MRGGKYEAKQPYFTVFLKINHYRWMMGIDEEQDYTVDVVNHKYTFQGIVSTSIEHTERL